MVEKENSVWFNCIKENKQQQKKKKHNLKTINLHTVCTGTYQILPVNQVQNIYQNCNLFTVSASYT